MKAVIFHIKLLQPVLAAHPGAGDENSSETYPFIPGSVLRGALIGRYLELHPGVDISRAAPGSPRPFFDGSCRFLNGYPLSTEGLRMLPAPLSWRKEKNQTASNFTVYDLAVSHGGDIQEPAGLDIEFARINQQQVSLHNPERMMQVHNASQKRGVKRSKDSFVYRYETLASGQVFEAIVIGEGAHRLCKDLKLAPGFSLRLGGSGSASYGKVELLTLDWQDDWKEAPSTARVDGKIILTLLSDAILTGLDGQPAVTLSPIFGKDDLEAFTRLRLVSGFNRKWGLPMPEALAIKAGSVFVYRADDISEADLARVVDIGIGERRAEGFGRVAINWQTQTFYNQPDPNRKQPSKTNTLPETPPPLRQPESIELAGKMAERRLRQLLDQDLARALARLRIENPPHPAQLARIRAAAKTAIAVNDLKVIPAHVDSLKSAADQLERARIVDSESENSSIRLGEWLKRHIDTVWGDHLDRSAQANVAGEAVKIEMIEMLKVEYTARLIDALCNKTARKIQTAKGGAHGRSMG